MNPAAEKSQIKMDSMSSCVEKDNDSVYVSEKNKSNIISICEMVRGINSLSYELLEDNIQVTICRQQMSSFGKPGISDRIGVNFSQKIDEKII